MINKPSIKKKRTVSSLKRELDKIFSRYIRLRECLSTTGSPEYGECITCDFHGEFNQLDAGHFMPRERNSTRYDERNVHIQCRKCNRFNHGELLEYRRQIVKMYGEGVDEELERESLEIKKFTVSELEQKLGYFQDKIRRLEND